jgi:hypothetical protein
MVDNVLSNMAMDGWLTSQECRIMSRIWIQIPSMDVRTRWRHMVKMDLGFN